MVHDNLLPKGWKWTTLGEIAELAGGGTPSREHPDYFTGDIVWLTPTEIPKTQVTVVSSSKEKITKEALKNSSARVLPKGTVLMTSRASIGFVAIAGTEVTTNQGFASFICKEGIYNYYLAYWLFGNAEFFKQQATGTTFKEIIKSKLRTFSLPLPPLPEQERIVAKIEALFTQLEAGTAALRRVQAGLKRYKASVLKAACEGRLVAQDPSDEPASVLLRRLGKSLMVVDGLPPLPEGWCWVNIGDMFTISYGLSESLSKTKPDNELDVAVIRIPNVTPDGILDISELKYFPLDTKTRDKLLLQKGDVLFNWRNAPKWIGRTAVFNRDGSFVNASFLLRLRPHEQGYSDFIALYINYLRISGYFMTRVDNAVNQANFNGSKTSQVPIALPPLSEQQRILSDMERRLSVVKEIESVVAVSLARAARLRQAILKQAFEGRLVAQDPEGEQAEALIETELKAEKKKADEVFRQARLF